MLACTGQVTAGKLGTRLVLIPLLRQPRQGRHVRQRPARKPGIDNSTTRSGMNESHRGVKDHFATGLFCEGAGSGNFAAELGRRRILFDHHEFVAPGLFVGRISNRVRFSSAGSRLAYARSTCSIRFCVSAGKKCHSSF